MFEAMPNSIRTVSHPTGLQLEFHPEPHHYILSGEKLTSVTSVIHNWFPQFDAESTAKKKAAREGIPYESLLTEWSRKRDEAASFGTKIHALAETILRHGNDAAADADAHSARERAYLVAVKEALRRVALGYEVLEAEKIVFSPQLKVAGTIDLLLRSKTTSEFVIADWKTNRELKYSGFRQEMGLGPCSHLENCNFSHYSLQTSAYGELLVREAYVPTTSRVRGVLLHLRETGSGSVVCDYVKTKDLATEVRQILLTFGAVPAAPERSTLPLTSGPS